MAIKYIFIDDEDEKTVAGIADFFRSKEDGISVSHIKPLASWSDQIKAIKILFNFDPEKRGKIKSNISEQVEKVKNELDLTNNCIPDGLILDLRLDVKVASNYKGSSFAQEIRNLSTDEREANFPLILCSGGNNLSTLYRPDSTSHDLFDLKIEKEKLDRESSDSIRKKLKALAKGYIEITKSKNPRRLLIKDGQKINIDYRILGHLETLNQKDVPPHEYAGFILRQIIDIKGPLIDEVLLAIRLGVDLNKTPYNDWLNFLKNLEEIQYKGVFCEGWKKWWMLSLIKWWENNVSSKFLLQSLTAEERVEKLNERFDFSLKPISEVAINEDSYFWYKCKETDTPLTLENGILAASSYSRVPWQEDEYYSPEYALEGGDIFIHPIHKSKLEQIKKSSIKKRKIKNG